MADSTTHLWHTLRARDRLFLLAGPCVIETPGLCLRIARSLKETSRELDIPVVFKASFDKANRTAASSYRGPGPVKGLQILAHVKSTVGLPILTDIHTEAQAAAAAEVVDILQIPAFLCRQTDLIHAAVATGKIVNLKKGQFLSPAEMGQVVRKARAAGGRKLLVTERGTCFGYQNLVSDMRAIPIMKQFGFPVVFDATHSVQLPGGAGHQSAGQREFAPVLARSAVAAGADGVFLETHPRPNRALSDGPNMIPLKQLPQLLLSLKQIHQTLR